ncbi:putative outer membrane protein [Pedobacter sp. UYP24]
MKRLPLIAIITATCFLYACSASRKTKITTLKPNTTNPSQGVINATGDALTIGIPSGNPQRAGSSENATAIANSAIAKLAAPNPSAQIRLDSLKNVDFINKAAASELLAISISMSIKAKNGNKKVKDYALVLVDEQSKAKVELSKLAADKNIVLSTAKTAGPIPATDVEYLNMIIDDYQNSIRLFEGAVRSKDLDIKAFANRYLPLLKKQLETAQTLMKEL